MKLHEMPPFEMGPACRPRTFRSLQLFQMDMRSSRLQAGRPALAALVLSAALALGVATAAASPARSTATGQVTLELRYAPNDPYFLAHDRNAPNDDSAQWNLNKEGFPRAWDYSRGDHVRVAVIDTGIDVGHQDLGGRVVDQGFHVGGSSSGNALVDTNGHGTHVSGLACATGDNGYGMVGAGFRCDLVVERATTTDTIDSGDVADSIDDAVQKGAKVINMSFGSDPGATDPSVAAAINNAWASDVVMVAAAQNPRDDLMPINGDQGFPASYLQPLGTASDIHAGKGLVVTDANYDGQNEDSGNGTEISMAAYGMAGSDFPSAAGILSAFPPPQVDFDCASNNHTVCTPIERCSCRLPGEDRFAYREGTSMAAAQVSGAAALIRAYRPELSAGEVITALKRYASGGGVWSNDLGWGILDAGAAINSVAPPGCVPLAAWRASHKSFLRRARAAASRRHRLWLRRHPHATPAQHRAWHRRDARARRAADRKWRSRHQHC
jgi:serine protease